MFLGELRSAQTTKAGPDLVTELSTGDSDQAGLLARSTASFGPGCNGYVVARRLLADMGCGVGNLASVASILMSTPIYQQGVVLKGNSLDHLLDLALSCGLEVKLQGQVAQWTALGQPINGQAYSLTPSTGLIGSPSLDTQGTLTCETLMLPGLVPGQPIVLSSKFVTGLFRVTSMQTTGDTAGKEWSHSIEAKRYGKAA